MPGSEQDDGPSPVPLAGEVLPDLPDAGRAVPVRHQGELLGALTVRKAPNEPLTPTEEKLQDDLASQAGLVLRNVRLTEELKANLAELRASRQRIVAAQDEERRRLERNIHDGAQQQLVALMVKLKLAGIKAAPIPDLQASLAELGTDAADALQNLRDLARGIYPPLLADQGLVAALTAQARKSAVPVQIEPDGVARYPQDVEAALYFCCLEALQNVAKYAHARTARIRLWGSNGGVRFEVEDDGVGFDPDTAGRSSGLQNMADRLEALGGGLTVRSAPGAGATISGSVRATALEPAG